MNAKEMFEELGYYRVKSDVKDVIVYIKSFDWMELAIIFYVNEKYYELKSSNMYICYRIFADEHKAINQQCKELGWLESEKE